MYNLLGDDANNTKDRSTNKIYVFQNPCRLFYNNSIKSYFETGCPVLFLPLLGIIGTQYLQFTRLVI